jgi:hypothetical protein
MICIDRCLSVPPLHQDSPVQGAIHGCSASHAVSHQEEQSEVFGQDRPCQRHIRQQATCFGELILTAIPRLTPYETMRAVLEVLTLKGQAWTSTKPPAATHFSDMRCVNVCRNTYVAFPTRRASGVWLFCRDHFLQLIDTLVVLITFGYPQR